MRENAAYLRVRLSVLFDAMQRVFYHNDSQIVELHATRQEDVTNPR